MNRRHRLAALLPTLLVCLACQDPSARSAGDLDTEPADTSGLTAPEVSAEPTPEVSPAGTTEAVVVRNQMHDGPQPADRWFLQKELRIGGRAGRGVEEFSGMMAFTVDPEGRIYISDRYSQEIRVFDADGTHSHSFGRQGQGPGEFLEASGLNWGPEGHLWVWDPGNRRFSQFTPSGELVAEYPRRVWGVGYPWGGRFTPEGEMIDLGLRHIRDDWNVITGTVVIPVNLGADLDRLDSLPALEFDRVLASDGRTRLPFGAKISIKLDRTGTLWVAHPRLYEISRRPVEGSTDLVFSLDAPPAPVTDQERDSLARGYRRLPPQVARERIPVLEELPSHKPVVVSMISDHESYLYVVPHIAGARPRSVIDVFTRDGVYQGRLQLDSPISTRPPPRAQGDALYVVRHDELDIPELVRYRIVRPE